MTPELEKEIVSIKTLRKEGDALIQHVRHLPPNRERSIVVTKLQEAVMWLGMDLKRINDENPGDSPTPYPNSKDPTNTIIEPTADNMKL